MKTLASIFLWFLLTAAFSEKFISPDINSHQGYATDGNYHYAIDTNAIYKKNDDATWSTAATNSNALNGLTGYNHLGDGDFYNGKLYLPCMQWNSCVDFKDSSICEYSAVDLTRIAATALPTNGGANEHDIAALAIDPEDGENGIIYVVDYCADTKIHKYDLLNYSYLGSVTMSASIPDRQGIAIHGGILYISGGTNGVSDDEIYTVNKNGISVALVHTMSAAIIEGLDYSGNILKVLIDSGAPEKVYYIINTGDGESKFKGVTINGIKIT